MNSNPSITRRISCFLAFIVLAFGLASVRVQAQTDPAGKVGYTTLTSIANGPCSKPGPGWDYQYSGWYFTDSNGVTHTFAGTSSSIGGKGCINFPNPAQLTGFTATSSDGLFTITTSGPNGTVPLGPIYPLYQVVSILYAPPGNLSSDGYTTGTTNGTTTNDEFSTTNAFSVSFKSPFYSESFGISNTTTYASGFQETFTDATSLSISSVQSNPNAINHDLDEFVLWLNPSTTFSLEGTSLSYSMGFQPLSNGAAAAQPDFVEVPAVVMQANASGNTSVPIGDLEPQIVSVPGGTAKMPGLAAICKNQKYYPNNCGGDPNGQCGCVPSDFVTILARDPLLNYNGTGTPYPGTVSPLTADYSGVTACASPTSADDCRYVPVPVVSGSSTPVYAQLDGPACTSCDQTPNTFTQTDQTTATQSMGSSSSQTETYSVGFSFLGAGVSFVNTDTFEESESTGTIGATSNSLTVTLNSSTVGCVEDVNIYEDTVYHTFVFQQPAGNTTCP
jgi:hypothetical protein